MCANNADECLTLICPRLAGQKDFWAHWGFVSWCREPFEGVARSQRFVKDGLLGPLAEYRAWEAIVWSCGSEKDRETLWHSLVPMPDVLTQRFLFVLDDPRQDRRIRSFWMGVRGYAEFFCWRPGVEADEKVRDLTGLIELALALERP